MGFKHVFGPVMSGRLGRSLGIDPIGRAVCSQDCLYCEAGRTTLLTTRRKAYAPIGDILGELEAWAAGGHPVLDYATLGGLGEPTLSSDLGEIIREMRRILPGVPVAVLTNSTTLDDPAVREELCMADVVLPSLDTLVPDEYRRLNRPAPGLGPDTLAEGLLAFRRRFAGKMFLEVLLAAGFNDSEENLKRIKVFCEQLGPDRVDVETLTRPGASDEARAVSPEVLARWRGELGAGVKSASASTGGRGSSAPEGLGEMILASIARRPQTADQLADALGAGLQAVEQAVQALLEAGLVDALMRDETTFYRVARER